MSYTANWGLRLPGCGWCHSKSTEFRARKDKLVGAGEFAFYATVQDVGREGLEQTLGTEQRELFQKWKASSSTGVFLIASIDEAKLDKVRLDTTLRRLADDIASADTRAVVLLSCRVAAAISGNFSFDAPLNVRLTPLSSHSISIARMSASRHKRTFVAYQNPAAVAGASRLWEIGGHYRSTVAISLSLLPMSKMVALVAPYKANPAMASARVSNKDLCPLKVRRNLPCKKYWMR